MNLQTPGVYFQSITKKHPTTALVRSDIIAFLAYARQGPVSVPVQIHSWRQYLAIFGESYAVGFLAAAVKGFFENGGAICYIVRVTDDTAKPASVILSNGDTENPDYAWKFSASYLLSASETRSGEGSAPDAANRLAAKQKNLTHVKRAKNAGQWANALSISVDREALSNTQTVQGIREQGFVTEVESITGLVANSIVDLYQEADAIGSEPIYQTAIVDRVDLLNNDVYWKQSLRDELNFDLMRPIRLQNVEFSVHIAMDSRIVEHFTRLTVHPEHERFLVSIINSQSRYVELTLSMPESPDESDYVNPEYWPSVTSNTSLHGGTDGLTGIRCKHYLDNLKLLEQVEDIGLLAAPDLVLRVAEPVPEQSLSTVQPFACASDLEALPKGNLKGRVVYYPEGVNPSDEDSAVSVAVAGVTVTQVSAGQKARTDANGVFSFSNIETGLVTLRFEKTGFEISEQMTFVQGTAVLVDFYLTPLLFPPPLGDNDIIRVQQAMADHAEHFYRFALLDTPNADMKLDQIRGWRQKLGNTAYAALYYPWLGIPQQEAALSDGGLKWIPPCGHIAGVIARTDLGEGVHRAPANAALRNVKRLSVDVNEAHHGILNSEGIIAIRCLPGYGLVPFGARTLSSDSQWRYLNVRRFISALEKTLEKSLQWAVFENNNTLLRQAVSYNIAALLNRLWRQGALAGEKPEAAFAVKCNEDNNPSMVRNAGQLIAEVAVAPSIPFEFIVFKLGKTMEVIEVTE